MSVKPLAICLQSAAADKIISYHQHQWIEKASFLRAIQQRQSWYRQQPGTEFALYHETSYPFAVDLFALWLAQKRVWIPGNNRPATATQLQQQGCQLIGDWKQALIPADATSCSDEPPALSNLSDSQLILFTSGSNGQPKAVSKTLAQLEAEIAVLEHCWGETLGTAAVAATVSHQHIYGLLFKLLWPLAAGRCFHSSLYLSPESLLKAITLPCCWIASPAQLKRLDENSPWSAIQSLAAVFSSGGPLPEQAAQALWRKAQQAVIEIYGSTETGGIGWRKHINNPAWQPLPGVHLRQKPQTTEFSAPWQPHPLSLDDKITLHDTGTFSLHGRQDTIVKIEEKRLSLLTMQHALTRLPDIQHAHLQLIQGHRDTLAAAIVLTPDGFKTLQQTGRNRWIKQLRQALQQHFDSVLLPRKWLFLNRFPETPQGKPDNDLLSHLLTQNKRRYPLIHTVLFDDQHIQLQLLITDKLAYFEGHFSNQPILPGVSQIAWADHYGQLFFTIRQGFSKLEVIKFKKTIFPDTLATLQLKWNKDTGKLYFSIDADTDAFSSGRIVYRETP